MPDAQTTHKRARRTVAVADLLAGIESAMRPTSCNRDPGEALAHLSGWVKRGHPDLCAAPMRLAQFKRD